MKRYFDYKAFGKAIADKQGCSTLETLAAETGLAKSSIMRIRNCEAIPSMDTIILLCEWMGRTVQYFIKEKTPKNGKNKKG